jgi:hypothetical protein
MLLRDYQHGITILTVKSSDTNAEIRQLGTKVDVWTSQDHIC